MSLGSGRSTGDSTGSRSGPDERRPSVEEILGAVEREVAPPGFTARVLARAQQTPRGRLPRWLPVGLRTPLAAAAALAVAGLAGFLLAPRLVGDRPEPGAPPGVLAERGDGEAEALRGQLQALERELHELQRLAAERQPLIAVEGDHADYVIDLRDFLPTTKGPDAVPASFDPNDAGRRARNR